MKEQNPDDGEETPASRFFANLERGRFTTTRCPRCGTLHWQPRLICPHCLARPLEWCRLPHTGTVIAFSQTVSDPRRAVGLIEIEYGVRLVSTLENERGTIKIGSRATLKINRDRDGGISFTFLV